MTKMKKYGAWFISRPANSLSRASASLNIIPLPKPNDLNAIGKETEPIIL